MKLLTQLGLAAISFSTLFASSTPWNALSSNTALAIELDNSKELSDALQKETKLGAYYLDAERSQKFKERLLSEFKKMPESVLFFNALKKSGISTEELLNVVNSQYGFAISDLQVPAPKQYEGHVFFWLRADAQLRAKIKALQIKNNPDSKTTTLLDFPLIQSLSSGSKAPSINTVYTDEHIIISAAFNSAIKQTPQDNLASFQSQLSEKNLRKLEGFVQRLKTKPTSTGLSGYTKPAGQQIFKSFISFQNLKRLQPMVGMFLPAIGLARTNSAQMDINYHKNKITSSAFLEIPTPRTGLAKMLEQQKIALAPPAWVRNDVMAYNNFSLDLNKILDVALELGNMFSPQKAQDSLNMANTKTQNAIGVDLRTLLSSLGTSHHALTYGFNSKSFQQNQAIIIDFKDPALLERLYTYIEGLDSPKGKSFTAINEEGFKGFSVSFPGSHQVESVANLSYKIFLSHGKIIFTQGGSHNPQLLRDLKTPPKAKEQLVKLPMYQEFFYQEKPSPALAQGFTNGELNMQNSIKAMKGMATSPLLKSLPQFSTFLKIIQEYTPSEKGAKGMIGYSYNKVQLNEKGLVLNSTTVLPAP